MYQYMYMDVDVIKDKSGASIRVNDFRKRIYPNRVAKTNIKDTELLRPDILIARVLNGNVQDIGSIVDANEKDIFSFKTNDTVFYKKV